MLETSKAQDSLSSYCSIDLRDMYREPKRGGSFKEDKLRYFVELPVEEEIILSVCMAIVPVNMSGIGVEDVRCGDWLATITKGQWVWGQTWQ